MSEFGATMDPLMGRLSISKVLSIREKEYIESLRILEHFMDTSLQRMRHVGDLSVESILSACRMMYLSQKIG